LDRIIEADLDLMIAMNDVSVLIPVVVLEQLRAAHDGDVTINFNIATASPEPTDFTGTGLTEVIVRISVGGQQIIDLDSSIAVAVDVEISDDVSNINKVVAVDANGNIIGGSFDPITGLFIFATDQLGSFTIIYIEDIVRLVFDLSVSTVVDITGDEDQVTMDVLPIVDNGIVFLPFSYVAAAAGDLYADVEFIEALIAELDEIFEDIEELIAAAELLGLEDELAELIAQYNELPIIVEGDILFTLEMLAYVFGLFISLSADGNEIEVIGIPN
jgi:hypothetical protein